MKYEPPLFRPPSEADALIVQATIGCSWNHCTYCGMYRGKQFRVRPVSELLDELREAAKLVGSRVRKLFVADGDALAMPMDVWMPLLGEAKVLFPKLRRISCYATAQNLLGKSPEQLAALRQAGLELLYVGPESGDDETLKAIAKGATFAQFVEASDKAHEAGLALSVIVLLGVGGTERSEQHALRTGELMTRMDPKYLSALTLMVVEGTPTDELVRRGRFTLPDERGMLEELRTIVRTAKPTDAMFRTNHASNYLPLAGRLPRDRDKIVETIDAALSGRIRLRAAESRGL